MILNHLQNSPQSIHSIVFLRKLLRNKHLQFVLRKLTTDNWLLTTGLLTTEKRAGAPKVRRIPTLPTPVSNCTTIRSSYEGANLSLPSRNGNSPPHSRKSLNPARAVLTFGFYRVSFGRDDGITIACGCPTQADFACVGGFSGPNECNRCPRRTLGRKPCTPRQFAVPAPECSRRTRVGPMNVQTSIRAGFLG